MTNVNMPKNMSRVETGVIQFGDDWPGYFLRGDDALRLAMTITSVLESDGEDIISIEMLKSWGNALLEVEKT